MIINGEFLNIKKNRDLKGFLLHFEERAHIASRQKHVRSKIKYHLPQFFASNFELTVQITLFET